MFNSPETIWVILSEVKCEFIISILSRVKQNSYLYLQAEVVCSAINGSDEKKRERSGLLQFTHNLC